VWEEFMVAADAQRPFGTRTWRSTNRVTVQDALATWPKPRRGSWERAIVYADPPYSKDHYSRYYHVLETLVKYDYPQASGAGRYRPDRFATPFSLKRQVQRAFDSLFARIAERDWSLVLSYPSNGLVPEADLHALVAAHFRDTRLAVRRPIAHSTLGGRHGRATNAAEELMWVACRP
jgi:adenine-specific DNA-methyltransferase